MVTIVLEKSSVEGGVTKIRAGLVGVVQDSCNR